MCPGIGLGTYNRPSFTRNWTYGSGTNSDRDKACELKKTKYNTLNLDHEFQLQP